MVINTTSEVTERAGAALAAGLPGYTDRQREQVAYLMALAYDTGRVETYRRGIAEIYCPTADMPALRETWEEQVARRHREMEGGAAREARRRARLARPHKAIFDAMDWPPVAVPGTVDISTVVSEWPCECRRRADGSHRISQPFPTRAAQASYGPAQPVQGERRLRLVTGGAA